MIFFFRFTIPLRNFTICWRNSNAEFFDYGTVWVYAFEKESEKSAGGKKCEYQDDQMVTSAVEWQTTFTCPIHSRKISIHVQRTCIDDDLAMEVCEVYGI